MTKKIIKPKVIWAVMKDGELVSSHSTFLKAKDEAEKTIETDEGSEVQIFEIVKVWEMGWPEEPSPYIFEVGLDTFL